MKSSIDEQTIHMVVTDLDGTLLQPDHTISLKDYQTLLQLRKAGICRVIATGRSLFSAQIALADDLPLDYLIFSSGAGIVDWKTKQILFSRCLEAKAVGEIAKFLIAHNFDFMIQDPIPENHTYAYFQTGRENPDFELRNEIYHEFARPLDIDPRDFGRACQIITIIPQDVAAYEQIRRQLNHVKVIRATSPLDGNSIWVEIFPRGVSKGHATEWLCERISINPASVLGIGNDYNDIDLLEWVGHAVVLANAPADLKETYEVAASNSNSGFSNAVRLKITL
ncbi:MAG: HAD family phosphatase [Deltaproteobacteria bacterium]|nr:HAD family phosphatase [Deltaproteobacteria bacterium]